MRFPHARSKASVRKASPVAIMAQAMRASLLAIATLARAGLREKRGQPVAQRPLSSWRKALRSAVAPPQSLAAIAPPKASNRLMVRLPCLAMAQNLFLPPLEFWRGGGPGQAEKPRLGLKTSGSGTLATIAEAVIVPPPGMLASDRLTGFC